MASYWLLDAVFWAGLAMHCIDIKTKEYYYYHKSVYLHMIITSSKLSWLSETWLNCRSPEEGKDQTHISHSAVRDVFGESDDEEAAEYAVHDEIEQDSNVSIRCHDAMCLVFVSCDPVKHPYIFMV